ncbi:hypothetical protein B0T26DRAFT_678624 [Lasiosphaeria miniovina]|uniref:Uncharacterized protein n=1 Tax=Lasiosphaeria miniovina TaxID=1954250 RepID=A0AA40DQ63_9PEZI|nr:uncharacterized protein B0T26DRAFT_678624 [Lasiosphaeria miniovina]KAK0709162.1 hypothetical protein B0T26DRAFT_678624 [Lasiosphaeria miniovina]
MRVELRYSSPFRPTSHKASRPYYRCRRGSQLLTIPPSLPAAAAAGREQQQPVFDYGAYARLVQDSLTSHNMRDTQQQQQQQRQNLNIAASQPSPPSGTIRDLQASRFEIALLALGILVLVAQMGVLLWIGVVRRPHGAHKRGQRWGGGGRRGRRRRRGRGHEESAADDDSYGSDDDDESDEDYDDHDKHGSCLWKDVFGDAGTPLRHDRLVLGSGSGSASGTDKKNGNGNGNKRRSLMERVRRTSEQVAEAVHGTGGRSAGGLSSSSLPRDDVEVGIASGVAPARPVPAASSNTTGNNNAASLSCRDGADDCCNLASSRTGGGGAFHAAAAFADRTPSSGWSFRRHSNWVPESNDPFRLV